MILYLLVSQMCNIRCNFCYQENFGTDRLSDEILYRKLKPLYPKVKFIPIVGGEVTIVPGMKEYVTWLKENYPHIDIVIGTNGVAFDNEWVDLCRKYKLMINYSLNAVHLDTYKSILNGEKPEQIFRAINKNFQELLYAQIEDRDNYINEISMVVTDYTACDVEDFILKGLEWGVNPMIRFNVEKDSVFSPEMLKAEQTAYKLKYFCENYITVTPWHSPNFQEEDRIMHQLKKDFSDEKKSFLKNHKKKKALCPTVTYLDYLIKANGCPVIKQALAVGFDGSVVPCYNLPEYVLGNLYYHTLDEILDSPQLCEIREQIEKNDYKYCFERCPLNQNPTTSIKNARRNYTPLYEKYFSGGELLKALNEYKKIVGTPLFKARQKYEMAYCLHVGAGKLEEAIDLYTKAYEENFDEFWIKYNRAAAYIDLGNIELARNDIADAEALNPEHEGILLLKERLLHYGE
ncbi:SPASM domain-containing protein [Lachnospiraceae bacterium 47-T17]